MTSVACCATWSQGSIQRGAAYSFLEKIPSHPSAAMKTSEVSIALRRNRPGNVPSATPTGRISHGLISMVRFGWIIPKTVITKNRAVKKRRNRLMGQELPSGGRIRQEAIASPALTPAIQYQGATDSLTNKQ